MRKLKANRWSTGQSQESVIIWVQPDTDQKLSVPEFHFPWPLPQVPSHGSPPTGAFPRVPSPGSSPAQQQSTRGEGKHMPRSTDS